MNVSLTDELEKWIETRVASGLYRSSSEVVREAVRLLREKEESKELRRQELRALIDVGLQDLEQALAVCESLPALRLAKRTSGTPSAKSP